MNEQINLNGIVFTILRIIEGGMDGDKDKIVRYGKQLAKRLDEKGYDLEAKCIRERLYVENDDILCPSCWKEGEHEKEYNNINTSASIEDGMKIKLFEEAKDERTKENIN